MYVVYGTGKFLERVGAPSRAEVCHSTSVLGDWYATVLFWKPQVGLFVNESTLLPVLLPFATAATVIDRFPKALATVLRRHGIGEAFIEDECAAMADHHLAKTKSRSVVGMMTEFAFLGGAYAESEDAVDLVELPVAGSHPVRAVAQPPRQSRPGTGCPHHQATRLNCATVRRRTAVGATCATCRSYDLGSHRSPRRGHG